MYDIEELKRRAARLEGRPGYKATVEAIKRKIAELETANAS